MQTYFKVKHILDLLYTVCGLQVAYSIDENVALKGHISYHGSSFILWAKHFACKILILKLVKTHWEVLLNHREP